MATKNLVPRATGEGQLGTTNKNWQHVFAVQGNFNQLKNTSNSELLISENTSSLTITHDATNNQYKFNVLGGGGASTSGFRQFRLVVADGSDALSEANWEINDNHHLLPTGNSVSNLGAVDKKVANVYATTGIIDTVDTDAIKFDDTPNNEYFKIVIDGANNKLQVKRYNDSDVLQDTKDLAYSSDAVSLGTSKLSALQDVTYPSALAIDEFLISREVENGVIKFENKDVGSARTILGLATNSNVEFGTLKLTASDSNNNGLGLDVVKPASFGNYTGDDAVIIDNGRGIYGKIADSSNIALTIGNNTNHKTKIQGELSLEKIRLNNNSALSILKYDNSATNQYVDLGGMKIQNIALPTADTDVANKVYVDSVASGLSLIASVKAATTAPFSTTAALSQTNEQNDTITLANGEGGFNSGTNKYIVDSIELAQDDRVLIKDKTTHNGSASFISNGVYTVGALDQATLTLTRATDFTAAALTSGASGAFVFVSQGTVNKGSGFVCHSLSTADTVGTHALLFTGFSSAGEFTGGNGITIDGTTIKTSLTGGTGITITDGASPSIAVDGVLEDLNALNAPSSNGQFIVATGPGAFAYESANTARTSLGLGAGDSPVFTSLTLSAQAAAIAMNSQKITGLATPTADGDAATKKYVDDNAGSTYTAWDANDNSVNYLDGATTAESADQKLDAQIKVNADIITTNTNNISGKQDSNVALTALSDTNAVPSKDQILVGSDNSNFAYLSMNDGTTRSKFGLGEAAVKNVYDGSEAAVAGELITVIEENNTKKLPVIDGSNLTGVTAVADLVLDTTPQLGGDLDFNSKVLFNIESSGNKNSINLNATNINLGIPKSGQNGTNLNAFIKTLSQDSDVDDLFSKNGNSEGSILLSVVATTFDNDNKKYVDLLKVEIDPSTNNAGQENGAKFRVWPQGNKIDSFKTGDIVYVGNLNHNGYTFDGLWMVHGHDYAGTSTKRWIHLVKGDASNSTFFTGKNEPDKYTMPKELFNVVRNDVSDYTKNAEYSVGNDGTPWIAHANISFIRTENVSTLIEGTANYKLTRNLKFYQGSNFGAMSVASTDNPNKILSTYSLVDPYTKKDSIEFLLSKVDEVEIKKDTTPELGGDLNTLNRKIYSNTSDVVLENSSNKILINNINNTEADAIAMTAQSGGIKLISANNKDIEFTTSGTGQVKFSGLKATTENVKNDISIQVHTGTTVNLTASNLGILNTSVRANRTAVNIYLPQSSSITDGAYIGVGGILTAGNRGRSVTIRPNANDNNITINSNRSTYKMTVSPSLGAKVECYYSASENNWFIL